MKLKVEQNTADKERYIQGVKERYGLCDEDIECFQKVCLI